MRLHLSGRIHCAPLHHTILPIHERPSPTDDIQQPSNTGDARLSAFELNLQARLLQLHLPKASLFRHSATTDTCLNNDTFDVALSAFDHLRHLYLPCLPSDLILRQQKLVLAAAVAREYLSTQIHSLKFQMPGSFRRFKMWRMIRMFTRCGTLAQG